MSKLNYVIPFLALSLLITFSFIKWFYYEIEGVSPIYNQTIFFLFASLSIIGGIIAVVSGSVIRSALGLFTLIVSLTGLYIQLSAEFVAVVQFILYGGAVIILFLFATSMMKINRKERETAPLLPSRYLSSIIAILISIFILEAFVKFIWSLSLEKLYNVTVKGNIRTIGELLTGKYLLVFELISILLIIVIIGGVSIAKKDKEKER